MANYLHYHGYQLVVDRINNHGQVPFDKIATDISLSKIQPGDTIWGFTGKEGRWYVMGRLDVTWVGSQSNVPSYVTSEHLFEEKKNMACCESENAGNYRMVEVEELAYAYLPDYSGGIFVKDLKNAQKMGFLERVDDVFVAEQLNELMF